MVRRDIWKMPATLAVFCLVSAMVFVACGNPAQIDVDVDDYQPPPEPTSITVIAPDTPDGEVSQYGSWRFTATVMPYGASQLVDWTVEPAAYGTIGTVDGDGVVIIPTEIPGSRVTVRATARDHPGISSAATVTISERVAPSDISIRPEGAAVGTEVQVGIRGRQQFFATVYPQDAPQDVIWSIPNSTNFGTITAGGLLTVEGASTGTSFVVRATVESNSALFAEATVFVPHPISITIAGIGSEYHSYLADIYLVRRDGTRTRAARSNRVTIAGTQAIFDLYNWGENVRFATPGDYEVFLMMGEEGSVYRIASRHIAESSISIPLGAFSLMLPINVTINGIPERYHNSTGNVRLLLPGTMLDVAGGDVPISGASAGFSVRGAALGLYDVSLAFGDGFGTDIVYVARSRSITGGPNNIQFGHFTPLQPRIIITVTGIPVHYHSGEGAMEIRFPEPPSAYNDGQSFTTITSAMAVFRFWFSDPGRYHISLHLDGPNRWGNYTLPVQQLAANTVIRYADLFRDDGGAGLRLTN